MTDSLDSRIADLERQLHQYRSNEAAMIEARRDLEKTLERLTQNQAFTRKALQMRSAEALYSHILESAVQVLGMECGILFHGTGCDCAKKGGGNSSHSVGMACNLDVPDGLLLDSTSLPLSVCEGKVEIGPVPDAWGALGMPALGDVVWIPFKLPQQSEWILVMVGVPLEKQCFYPGVETLDREGVEAFRQQAEAVYAYFNELEQRKLAEAKAQTGVSMFRALFDEAPIPMFEIDASGLRDLVIAFPPGEQPGFRETANALLGVKPGVMNAAARKFYGAHDPQSQRDFLKLSSLRVALQRFMAFYPKMLTGEGCVIDAEQNTPKGRVPVKLHFTVSPGAYETWKSVLVAVIDMSKEAEAQRVREELGKRLKRAEKMEALGLLAGGVAHDLNNVLVSLVGMPDLLMDEVRDRPEAYEMAQSIRVAGMQAAAFVQDLLTMARQGLRQLTRVDVNDVLRDYLSSPPFKVLASIRSDVRVVLDLHEEPLIVMGSSVHLTKVWLNIVTNGFEAIKGTGRLAIRSGLVELTEERLGYERIPPGHYVTVEMEDSGTGIAPEHVAHIFEPFYTRKSLGKSSGTGLGMAVVWGVLRDHNAFIDLKSEEGKGTCFTIYIPAIDVKVEAKLAVPGGPLVATTRNEQILVVDDMQIQRDFLSKVLIRYGYRVECVAGGMAAVAWLQENEADLVLLDMIMTPGIDGLETWQQIIDFKPEQPAVLVSGYAASDRVDEALRLGVRTFLKKPFRPVDLVEVVQRELQVR